MKTADLAAKQADMLKQRRAALGQDYANHIRAASDARRQQNAIDKALDAMTAKEAKK